MIRVILCQLNSCLECHFRVLDIECFLDFIDLLLKLRIIHLEVRCRSDGRSEITRSVRIRFDRVCA